MNENNFNIALEILIANAIMEDVGIGDFSALSTIDKSAKGKAVLKIKDSGILAGITIAKKVFEYLQPDIVFKQYKNDGDAMNFGEIAFDLEADIHTILKGERLALNIMQRMSGIATLTKQYTNELIGFNTKLLDTRKTTPNFRLLEKKAVEIGGAVNHRMGLYDMIMLKDNHIDFCGGIVLAIEKANIYKVKNNLTIDIEVETRTIDDVKKVLSIGNVKRIMLDNFTPELCTEAVKIINGKFETEASGGINITNLKTYAATGVDYISSGAIIHQAKSLDLSLKANLI